MKPRIAVVAQTADPAYGSEFATGWAMVSKICAHPLLLERFDLDVYISKTFDNDQRILASGISELQGLNLKFIPLIWPSAHRFIGRFLRICWQFKVAVLVVLRKYDVLFQVSPNSITYANPLFFLGVGPVKIVGPMRIEPWASVKGLYWHSSGVLARHLAIKVKEAVEWITLAPMRAAIKRNAALHIEPFAVNAKAPNQFYCRETAMIDVGNIRAPEPTGGILIMWSGQGDPNRKNEHLAQLIVAAVMEDPRFWNVRATILGGSLDWPRNDRVDVVQKIPRPQLLRLMNEHTVYLCTSLLELNSVMAEEVLIMRGAVVAGPLPGLVGRPDTARIGIVDQYAVVSEWLDKILELIGGSSDFSDAAEWRGDIVDRLVNRILASIPEPRQVEGY